MRIRRGWEWEGDEMKMRLGWEWNKNEVKMKMSWEGDESDMRMNVMRMKGLFGTIVWNHLPPSNTL